MNRIKTMVFLLALTATLASQADERVLKVWQANGQVLTISLADEPRTTYKDGNLVITSTKTSVTLPLEQVRRYTYETVSTGIVEPKVVHATISKDGETLTLTGLKPGTTLQLYNVAGQLLRTLTSGSQSKTVVTVSNLPSGVYVVKANDVTYKITKQ